MSTDKPPIRWDWIETQWQRGTLSNVQIAKLHAEEFGREIAESAIRYRATSHGWQRDVSEAIRREARAKLAKRELRETASKSANQNTSQNESQTVSAPGLEPTVEEIEAEEAALVERASDAMVLIELDQRERISRARALSARAFTYAEFHLPVSSSGEPLEKMEPGEFKDVIAAADKAIAAAERVINMERKSFGMDAPQNQNVGGGVTLVELPHNGRDTKPGTEGYTPPAGAADDVSQQ